jgi:hypothetical protein
MATSRAFTKNLGGPIAGTTQVGNLAYANPGEYVDYVGSGLKWYNGPDEDANPTFGFANDGYVIGVEGSVSSPDGSTAPFKFYRSNGKTEQAFIDLVAAVTGQRYGTGADAAAALQTSNIISTWTSNENLNVSYSQFSARTSACGQTNIYYYGSDNKYYINQMGDLFTGFLYVLPTPLGNNEWSWTIRQIVDGVQIYSAQEQSSCGTDGEQFLSPA